MDGSGGCAEGEAAEDFRLATRFYKKDGINLVASLPYDTRIQLMALLKQANHGP